MRVVIVGAGPAGITVAETLRQLDPTLGITLISAEPYPPYAPPALADHFLTGRTAPLYWKGQDVDRRLEIDYRMGVRVRAVDPVSRSVVLDDGTPIAYDRLVIASGSVLHAPVEGIDLPGIADFKSLSAATALVERVRGGTARTALIVGAGFIGVEVALLLRELGLAVTVIEMLDRVMPRMLDAETASIVVAAMRERGVDVRLETRAAAFVGERAAEGVRLESGELLRADVLVAATGVRPNVGFLEGAGIDLGWGVRVDDRLATGIPDVWAAGDVAETRDRLTGERYVHAIFPNAVEQGRIVAENVLGRGAVYAGAESMNSLRHLGLPVVAVGAVAGDEELRWRRDGCLRKVVLSGGRIVGYRLAGDIRAAGAYRALMLRGADVRRHRDRLLRPDFGLASLAP